MRGARQIADLDGRTWWVALVHASALTALAHVEFLSGDPSGDSALVAPVPATWPDTTDEELARALKTARPLPARQPPSAAAPSPWRCALAR